VLREEELIRIARMRRAKPWQEERRYIQALILYAVADWPLVLRARTHIPPFILVSERPRLGVFMGSAPCGASQPLRPRALVPAGEVSPEEVPPPGNGALLISCSGFSLLY
jgi:hypothetical protein